MPVHPSWILAASTASKKSGGSGGLILVIILVFGVFYLFNRSQKQNRRKNAARQNAIEIGQRVITTSGIYATVVSADDESFELEVAEGVVIRFAKGAVSRAIPVDSDDDDTAGSAEAAGDGQQGVDLTKGADLNNADLNNGADVDITTGFSTAAQHDQATHTAPSSSEG